MRYLLGLFLAGWAPASAVAAGYFPQASIPVAAGAVYAMDRDALGNLYVLGLPAGSTQYMVSGYQTPDMTPLFAFETGVSSPVAFVVEDSGIVDVLDASTSAVTLKRFDNAGAFLGQASYLLAHTYETNTLISASIDKANGLVYIGYRKWATRFCLACLGCSCPPPAWVGTIEQHDFSGTLLRFITLPGASSTAGSCYTPSLLTPDPQGSLYVADDLCQHLLKFSMTGAQVSDVPASGWSDNYFTPRGMWSDPASRLYISQPVCGASGCQPGIVKLDGAANVLATLAADSPRGCAWDERVLYLSSAGQSPLRRWVDNGVPTVPSEIAPIGPVLQHSSSPALAWQHANDPDGDAVTYFVGLGTSPSRLVPIGDATMQSFETLPLAFETTYYWQVAAGDSYKGIPLQRQPAPVVSFRLSLSNSAPGAFSVLSGTGTAVTRDASVRLAWSPSSDPDGDPVVYDVAWRAAGQAVPATSTMTATTLTMSGLAFGTTYYWSLRARDVYGVATAMSGPAEQSYMASFRNSPPGVPAYLASPSDYWLHTTSPNVTLGWAPSEDPDGDGVSHRLDLTTGGETWSVELGTATSFTVPAVFKTTYSWRVTTTDSYGAAATGAWRAFIAHLANQTPAPILYTSADTLITRATSYALSWQDTGDPDGDSYSYSLFLSTDPGRIALVQTGLRTSYPLAFQYGTTYYWQVTATDSFGARAEGAVRAFLGTFRNTAPGMPTILSGSGESSQHTLTPSATLSWSTVSDPEGDAVAYRLWAGGSPQTLALVQDGPQTSYSLPSPQFGTTYYWQAGVYDPHGGVATTPMQSLLIQLQNAAPSAPGVLNGTGLLSTRNTSQVLSWSAAYEPDGDPVSYEFALSTDPATLPALQVSTATSYTLAFQYGTTYYWQATARDGLGGVSGTGMQAFLPVFRNAAPTVPTNLSKAGTVAYHGWSPSQSLFWQDAVDPDGDAFTYSVAFGTDSERPASLGSVPLGHTVPNLAVNTAYYYRVVATDFYGAVSSSPLNWVYYQFTNGAPRAFDPAGPSGLVVTRDANQTLSWTASSDPDGDLVTYRVHAGTSPGSLAPRTDTTQTSVQWPNLPFGATYYWRVEAFDSFGATTPAGGGTQSFYLAFRNAAPPAPGYSSAPSIREFHTTSPSLDLTWSASADPDGDAVSYRLDLGPSTGSAQGHELAAATGFNLAPLFETTYYWRVTAADPYGGSKTGPWASVLARFVNRAPAAPEPLTGTGALSTRATSQLLSWSAAADPEGDAVAYELALATDPAALPMVQASTATSYLLSFKFGTTYYWQVTARDTFGAAGASAVQVFQPAFRNAAPSAPANLSKAGTILYHGWSPSQALFWQDAADPDGDAFTYSVQFGTDSERLSTISPAALGRTFSSLAVNTAYYYRIVATDIFGAASASPLNWVYYQFSNAAPRAFDPAGPSGIVVTRDADQTLAWAASSDPDGDLVTYRVYAGTAAGGLSALTDTTQAAASWPDLAFGATYYWRVEAYDGFGGTTPASGGTRSFYLAFRNSPPNPVLYVSTAATYNLHTDSPTVTLAWGNSSDPDGDPVAYRLEVRISTSAWPVSDLDGATSFALHPLFETTYTWRVTASDAFGGVATGPWASFVARFVNQPPSGIVYTSTSTVVTRATSHSLTWRDTGDPDGDSYAYSLLLSTTPSGLALKQQGAQTSFDLTFQFGTTYYWQVSAKDSFGAVTTGGVQTFLPVFKNAAPTTPENLTRSGTIAYHGTSPSLTFFWQDSSDPDGDGFSYSLFFGTDPAKLTQLSPLPLGHTFSNLAVNTAYYYRIVATDIHGASSDSPVNWVYFQFFNNPPRAFEPVGPIGLVVTRDANQTLSWTASSDPDGDLVAYRVYVGTSASSLAPLTDTTQTSAQWAGLAFGSTYYWRVAAYDAFGATTTASGGIQSFGLNFRNSPPTAPGYPGTFAVHEFHTQAPEVALNWSSSSDSDGDAVSYRLDLGVSTATFKAYALGAATSFSLAPTLETTYYWRITAADPYGGATSGSWSSFVARFVNRAPSTPSVLGGSGVTRQHTLNPSATLAWSAATDPDGDPTLFRLSVGSAPQLLSIIQDGSLTSYAIPSPQLGATYYWQVSAYDPYGGLTATSVQSLLVELQNAAPVAPAPLAGMGILSTRNTSQLLSWSAAADPDGDPVSYEFSLSTNAASLPVVQASSATSFPLAFQYGTTYYWQVTARDGFGGLSATGVQTLLPVFKNSAPTVPSNLSKTGTLPYHGWSPSQSIFWQDAADPDGDAFNYSVYFGTESERPSLIGSIPLGFTVQNLAVNTAYYYRIVATDIHGAASTSPLNWVYYQFFNNPPRVFDPVGPTGTLVTRNANQSLSWTASSDPDGDLVSYRVLVGTAPGPLTPLTDTTQTAASWAGLPFGATYYWRVDAYDSFGATTAATGGTQSFGLAFRNSAPTMPGYSGAAAMPEFHTLFPNLDLTWSASSDADGDSISYRLDLGLSTGNAQAFSLGAATTFTLHPLFETTYYWRVTAIDPYGGTTTGPWASVLARFVNRAPAAPTVLAGAGISRQHTLTPSASLSWSTATDPDGDGVAYRLALGSSPQSLSLVQDGPLTSYALPAAQLGTTYYWQVSAYDPYGGAAATPLQSLLLALQNSAPAAPEPLSGTGPLSTRTTSQLLSWSAAADPEGDPVAYELTLSTDPAALPLVQASTATSYLLTFQYGATYYWQATARDGFGAASTTGLQVFQPAFRNSAPSAPPNLSKSGTIPYHGWTPSLSLFWEDAADTDGDAFAYSIRFGTDSERLSTIAPAALGHTFASLAVNTAYYYRILATDVHGAVSASPLNWVYHQFTNGTPRAFDPIGPAGMVVTRDTDRALSWTASSDPDADLVTYRVYAGTAPGALAALADTTLTSVPWPGLAFGATYYWRVEAYDTFGATTAATGGVQSFALAFRNTAPSAPLYASTAPVREFHTLSPEVSLNWAPSTDPDGDAVAYRLDLGASTSSWQSHWLAGETAITLNPLFDTTYYWRVSAADSYGGTTAALWASFVARFANRAPAVPAVLGGSGVRRQHTLTPNAALSWSEVNDPESDSVHYRLTFGTSPTALAPIQEGASTSYALPSPLFGTTYYWQVSAIDAFGAVSTTPVQNLLIALENTPPAAFAPLTGMGALATRQTTQLISWEASRDAESDPLLYGLYLSSGAGAPVLAQLSTATSFLLAFQYATTYTWRAEAYDGFGGTTTATGGAQTFSPIFLNDPPAPLKVTSPFKASPVVSTMHDRVSLSWERVTTPQGDPVTYTVYLGDSPDSLRVLTRIGQEQAPAGFVVSNSPSQARPQSEVQLDGETLRLTLSGLNYYHPYYFRIEASNPYGASTQTPLQTFSLSASNGFPKAYNYPNPFSAARGGTRIVFNAPPSGYAKATVSIYSELQDLLFRREYPNIAPGISEVAFDGRDRYGRSLFNGSYICHVRFEGPDDKETFYLMVVR